MNTLVKLVVSISSKVLLLVTPVLFVFLPQLAGAQAVSTNITIEAIPNFLPAKPQRTKFGSLHFIGGLEFSADDERVGGISSIAVLEQGKKFLAVGDQGIWFTGQFDRDDDGKITGISKAALAPLLDEKARIITSKKNGDAEGIEIVNGHVLVSFERKHRVQNYALDLENLSTKALPFRPSLKKKNLKENKSLEAIVVLESPIDKNLEDLKIAVFSENTRDKEGNIKAYFSNGKDKWKKFTVKKSNDFNITDATRIPGNQFLLLERKYSIISGPEIRIRKFHASAIKSKALIEGEVIFQADYAHQIDNLEGLSAWKNNTGQTVLTLVSDNNFSFTQRNLILEFILED